MKMTLCQCRKGSGFLNGSWRHVSCFGSGEEFSSTKKTNKLKLVKQCGRQASNIKTWSFEMFLRSYVIRHQSFISRSTSLGMAKVGNLKRDFMAKSIGIHFWFEYIVRCYRLIPKPKTTFWPYGHFNIYYVTKVWTIKDDLLLFWFIILVGSWGK